jgi:hypothetical protein
LEVRSLVYFVYKSAKNIISVLHTWSVPRQDKFSGQPYSNHKQKMAEMKQALQMATTNTQLAISPTFSNNPKKTTAWQPSGYKN